MARKAMGAAGEAGRGRSSSVSTIAMTGQMKPMVARWWIDADGEEAAASPVGTCWLGGARWWASSSREW